MEQSDLLKRLVMVLDQLRIDYFITGSLASISYGEPRMTLDIDVVVRLKSDQLHRLHRLFGEPDYYLSLEAAKEAVRSQSQFNIIHGASGQKIDVIIAKRNPLTDSQFKRVRIIQRHEGYQMKVAAPEDIVISKMLFYKMGESDKHLRDIAGVLKSLQSDFDREYVEQWAVQLNVMDVWQTVLQRIKQK